MTVLHQFMIMIKKENMNIRQLIREEVKRQLMMEEKKLELKGISNVDHTRIIKWMGKNFNPDQYKLVSTSMKGDYVMDVDKLTSQEIEYVKNYLSSQGYL